MNGALVATGRRALVALGREQKWQAGGTGLLYYDPVLPSGGRLWRQTLANPSVNRRGVNTKGTPGSVMGDYPFEALLTPELALDFGLAVLGTVEKTSPAPGIFHYDFEDAGDLHRDVSFFGLGGLPPQYRQQLWGIRFADWQTVVEVGKQATLKAMGKVTHGTTLGPAQPGTANAGSSVPKIRGRMANPKAGSIHLRVTRDVAGGGLQFEVEVSADAPAWPGTFTYDAALDPTGDHRWQNLRDQAGQDIGAMDEAKDPVEVYFGDAATLAGYAVGDVFVFEAPNTWPTPALVQAGGPVFTNAHYRVEVRESESGEPWQAIRRTKATLMTTTELHENRGDDSNYAHQLYHTGVYNHTLQLERDYTDSTFDDLYDADRLLEVRHGFTGRLLDAPGEIREQVLFHLPAMEMVAPPASSAQNAGAVKETVDLEVRPDPSGGAPIRLRVTTDVDWTP